MNNGKLKIQIGAQFGKWTVLSFFSKKQALEAGHKGGAAYLCECSCPKKTRRFKSSTSLLKGTSTSCGCDRWLNAKTNSLAKYGVESAAQRDDIKAKRRTTNLIKYGVENPFQCESLIGEARKAAYTEEAKAKRKATNLAKYGVESLLSKDSPVRVTFKQTKESVSKAIRTKKITGSGINVLLNGMSVAEFCKVHGVNSQHANSIYREMGPEACEKYIVDKNTDTASFLERYFQSLMAPQLDLEFFNKNVTIDGKTHRPDFVVSDTLHVNVDGVTWHSDRYQKNNMYHFHKRQSYEAEGKQLLQFRSDEIFSRPEIVKSMLLHKTGHTHRKIFARKTEIRTISFSEAKTFLEKTHLMGAGLNGKAVGLFFESELIAVMTFNVKNGAVEILRFATALYTSVVGGLGKLLKWTINSYPDADKVISFVDLRYGNGNSLRDLGFKLDTVNLGWNWVDKFSKTQNRLRVRAKDGRSELTHASELGWAKIYDAGQAKFVLSLK